VVRHAGAHTPSGEVPHEAAERGAVREQDGEVEEPEAAGPADRLRARHGVQPHQQRRGPRRPKRGRAVPDVDHAQAQRVAVERDRAPEVRHLKPHATNPGARRQTRVVRGFLPPGLRVRDARS
jgi:hypothetical protein